MFMFVFRRRTRTSNVMKFNICNFGTKTKPNGVLDETVCQDIEHSKLNPKQHPGRVKLKAVGIPEPLYEAIMVVLKDQPIKALYEEGQKLDLYLKARHMPINQEELRQKQRNKIYNWKPIEYDSYKSFQYLVSRIAPEFAILNRIFGELSMRHPTFQPKSIFDFGSGVGSVTWAALAWWGKSLKEIYCVDTSRDMNDLAELLLRRGNPDRDLPVPGTYFRQFMPSSQTYQQDITVSAFSLFELPSTEARLNTLLNLWSKTKHFLVLIEQGSNASFKLIDEAKEFILYISQKKESAYIFAPCPHEAACPRLQSQDGTPCNFEVSYPPFLTKCSHYFKERFCYVIIGKGVRPDTIPAWPRIVRPTLVRRKHTICRLCTPAGKLQEIIFTPAKSGKASYRCARSSVWGDMLPITIEESVRPVEKRNANPVDDENSGDNDIH